jgi:hypothetical protein
MFFKKGLRDSSLIRKLTMKNPRMSEEMLPIVNKYALVEEVALDTKEKKEKELGHPDLPHSPKGHDKKMKANCSMNIVEWPHRNKEYRPWPGQFEGFLDRIYIYHPSKSTRLGTATDSKVLQMRCSRLPKRLIKRRSLKNQRVTSPRLIMRSATFMEDLTPMSLVGSKNS